MNGGPLDIGKESLSQSQMRIREFREDIRKRHINCVLEIERRTEGGFSRMLDDMETCFRECVEPVEHQVHKLTERVKELEA